jgi:alkanesulfonate monooxygenase SsuD/methylene tetrahydromethanopterin reductase-like flavin-dependent oxidoreductase (luciferase family)
MKLGVILEGETIESLAAQALAAETAGIDIAWLPVEADGDTAMLRAAAVAARTSVIRLAACAPVDGHPLEIAEAAAVADNVSNGRLIVVLQDAQGDEGRLEESAQVVLAALAPRPFRHDGPRWKVPGNLPENEQQEERILVTPQAVQPELPVWLAGRAAPVVARTLGLASVSSEDESAQEARAHWARAEAELGPVAQRLRRPSLHRVNADADGWFDDEGLVTRLRAEQRAWGADTAVMRLPAGLGDDARAAAAHRIAVRVRPRVTLYELPAGTEQHWLQVLT